jgi:hypothetical protein
MHLRLKHYHREKPQYFDATDVLSVAVCHHYQLRLLFQNSKKVLKAGLILLRKIRDELISS